MNAELENFKKSKREFTIDKKKGVIFEIGGNVNFQGIVDKEKKQLKKSNKGLQI